MSAVASNLSRFRYEPDAENPGWFHWEWREHKGFGGTLGPLLVRTETGPDGKQRLRLRMVPGPAHGNMLGTVHGGVSLILVDIALFAAIRLLLGGDGDNAATLDLTAQFFGAGHTGKPLDAVIEILRETGRLLFLRALTEQDGTALAAFSATVRKPSKS